MSSTAKKVRGQCDTSLWTTEKTLRLITLFEANNDLWNTSSPLYSNRNHKMNLQLNIAKALEIDVTEVISKFHNLRCQYNAELRKLKTKRSTGTDKLYVPRWKFFNAMKFLSCCGPTIKSTSKSMIIKNEESIEDEKPLNDTTINVMKFLEPDSRRESQHQNGSLSNLCDDSLHMVAQAELSNDHEENFETSSFANVPYNTNFLFEPHQKENCETLLANNSIITQTSDSSDMWDMVGKFVAINGREWAKENNKLANQFKTAIYKLLADFQARTAEAENQNSIGINNLGNS